MKTADLYIRVSTDEQADKGYSQRDQDDRLRKYCEINGIEVRRVIYEDHSAKTFIRPEWTKYIAEIKKRKGKGIDLVIFTKWDRFSSNAGDAYQMIGILMKLGIEPQAIEQPLNLEIPENKIMLAFYLAAPEVENDRRALNVTHGMRRARREGRYMGVAPAGYDNKTREDGTKHITPNLSEAPMLKWIFKTISEGVFVPDQIRKMANEQGLKISRMSFYRGIRNPVYCGKIIVKKYKDEEEQWVNGLHEPLISEALFYKVQDVISGRKKGLRVQAVQVNEALPLQGFLQCANCNRQLTGSASKGKKGGYYYYYHAQSVYGCGCRYRADDLNKSISEELSKFIPKAGMAELYKSIVTEVYKEHRGGTNDERKQLVNEIERLNTRLAKARELLFDEKLDYDDFSIMKKDCEDKIKKLEASLSELKVQKSNTMSIDNMLSNAIDALSNLESLYNKADVLTKKKILGSIFREKLSFDGTSYRTPRLNQVAELIFLINSGLRANKNGKERVKKRLSRSVLSKIQISNHFIEDLEILLRLIA